MQRFLSHGRGRTHLECELRRFWSLNICPLLLTALFTWARVAGRRKNLVHRTATATGVLLNLHWSLREKSRVQRSGLIIQALESELRVLGLSTKRVAPPRIRKRWILNRYLEKLVPRLLLTQSARSSGGITW